jgi:catechol 2,3-dioxygenase-like lactoylglutathione lyase family enzyme
VRQLDHTTISTDDIEATIRFYEDVIGLRNGHRPYAPPGAWLYLGDHPVVHLVTTGAALSADVKENFLHVRDHVPGIDHVAFAIGGYAAFVANLRERNVPYDEVSRRHIQQHQVFVRDPNGITVECLFDLADATAEARPANP